MNVGELTQWLEKRDGASGYLLFQWWPGGLVCRTLGYVLEVKYK